jgi:hypothetical protein
VSTCSRAPRFWHLPEVFGSALATARGMSVVERTNELLAGRMVDLATALLGKPTAPSRTRSRCGS